MLKNKDCLHFLRTCFFSLELWGSRVTDRALESAKKWIPCQNILLVHCLLLGVVRLPRGTTLIFVIVYYMNGLKLYPD